MIFLPFSFSVLSAVAPSFVFVFYMMNEGKKDASFSLQRVAEQLLALANTGKFILCLAKN